MSWYAECAHWLAETACIPFLGSRIWCRKFLLYEPSTEGGGWGNRCCWCTISTEAIWQEWSGLSRGHGGNATSCQKGQLLERVVISCPWFVFAFSLRHRAWDYLCCRADDVAVDDWRLGSGWGNKSESSLPLQGRPLDVCRHGLRYGSL